MTDRKLGDYSLALFRFPELKKKLDQLEKAGIESFSERDKIEKIHRLLLEMIQEVPTPCFLLAAVNEFIEAIHAKKWLSGYSLSKFELWLNLFSGLSLQENYFVRGKIMGKWIPREAYQSLFPIGMGKTYPGSHYVTAHGSPDLDTTIASFWGWVDAFAARVGSGLHIWNVPGGPPQSQVEIPFLFQNFFGKGFFDHFSKTRTSLALSAADLVSQEGMERKNIQDSQCFQGYDRKQMALILVDERGNYLGDWRHFDVEGVKKVTSLLSSCLRWFVSHFQKELTVFFSRQTVVKKDLTDWIQKIFSIRLEESEPLKEFTEKQKKKIEGCLVKVLKVSEGWQSSFGSFWDAMEGLSLTEFNLFRKALEQLPSSSLFDKEGLLVEHRPDIFHHLEKIVTSLDGAVQSLRRYVDQFSVALSIKKEVIGDSFQSISSRTEVEEIRTKMGSLAYLTVTASDSQGNLFPLGIISSSEAFKPILGTVSLRDFCNREETKIPSYFEVISVVDHHKSSFVSSSATTVNIADAQSANALVAELAFKINDEYSVSGLDKAVIEEQIQKLVGALKTSSECKLLQRLLQKKQIIEKKEGYFVHPHREYLEYLQCLYAILDDTDLLSKVSYRDVFCVASLLNRMKTLISGKEAEVVSLEDLSQDAAFAKTAAKRILQNEEMYFLYKKIYEAKEKSIEENLRLCMKGEPSSVFADTKVQNGCCRVGQTKLFAKNFPFYSSHAHEVRTLWYVDAKAFYEERNECDLHMHMISTVPGADDVYKGVEGLHTHQDELWIWVPMQEQAIEHLKTFLSAFSSSPQIAKHSMDVEFLGDNAQTLSEIFQESFSMATRRKTEKERKISIPVAVLRFKAGLLNSRKAMVSPYLPKLTS